jgi:hypothetical protein
VDWTPDERENTGRGPSLIAQARIDELREGAEAGDRSCVYWYLWLLRLAGRIEPMRRMMAAGAYRAAEMVVGYHAFRSDLAELRSLTEAGHEGAAHELAWVAHEQGELDVLRERAATGDDWATYLLATVLGDRGELAEIRAYAGEPSVGKLLVNLLIERGEEDEAIEVARALPRGHESLPMLLARREAVDELRAGAAEGLRHYRVHLVDVLLRRGEVDEARSFADDTSVQSALARYYRETGNEAELVAMADARTWRGEAELRQFYRERGDVDGLRRRAAADYMARDALIDTLAEQEAVDELWELARAGHGQYRLAVFLGERRDLDGLRELATFDEYGTAERILLNLLDEDELRAEDTTGARAELARRAVRRGDLAELLAYDWPEKSWEPRSAFVTLLVEHEMEDELRRRAEQDFPGARTGLHELLIKLGREEELLGDPDAEKTLAWRMVNERRFADLVAWAERGSTIAGEALWRHLDPGSPYGEERPDWY